MTIEELLRSMQVPTKTVGLENSKSTWSRIGQKDAFMELSTGGVDISSIISEFVENNDYNNNIG